MEKTKVLFVSQDITPYLKESQIGQISRYLPQGIQERGKEIRTFMPRFGIINERRNQLHEVIRLSGMNLIIDDSDHALIIKVASIQAARMQIYFIDNDDYFLRKYVFRDKNEVFFEDNDERSIFFTRGVIETVKKLGWAPDIIHCHGWLTSLTPLFIKRSYSENPLFSDSKVIMSLYDEEFTETLNHNFANKLKYENISAKDLKIYKKPTYMNVMKSAIDFSDAIILGSETVNPELTEYARQSGKPFLEFQPADTYIDAYNEFYNQILQESTVLAR
jgi:starch synthase